MESLESTSFNSSDREDCDRMIRLNLGSSLERPLEVLCMGAHSDDIEIGCGGTILRIAEEFPDCKIHWVVFSAEGTRESEARGAANSFAGEKLRSIEIGRFRDGFMPYQGSEVKEFFESALKRISPDVVFTHQRNDLHQDHRLISELSLNTFRNHLILEYEIPKYDGDLGRPSVFVPLKSTHYQRKIRLLLDQFESQRSKRWFEESTFLALMRLRGMECNASSGHAEAFYSRKVVL